MLKLKRELGISFLFITHDLAVAKFIADRVAVMYLGKIVEIALKDDLFKNPLHPYTKALLSSAPVPDPTKRDRERTFLYGEIPSASKIPSGCAFRTRCPECFEACELNTPLLLKPISVSLFHNDTVVDDRKSGLIEQNHQVSCLLYQENIQ